MCWVLSCGRKCGSMLSFILNVWELRKVRLYGDNPSIQQSRSQIAPGSCRVSLVEGVSCVWKLRQTLV